VVAVAAFSLVGRRNILFYSVLSSARALRDAYKAAKLNKIGSSDTATRPSLGPAFVHAPSCSGKGGFLPFSLFPHQKATSQPAAGSSVLATRCPA